MTTTASVDLSDFSLWRNGFPDELFTRLRRERPIFHHELTPGVAKTVQREFWMTTKHRHAVRLHRLEDREHDRVVHRQALEAVVPREPAKAHSRQSLNLGDVGETMARVERAEHRGKALASQRGIGMEPIVDRPHVGKAPRRAVGVPRHQRALANAELVEESDARVAVVLGSGRPAG